MSSNVNPYNINGAYPIAGQDNDSQGFRDNFTNIRTNLAFAKEEIEDLQNKVVLKAALEGGTIDNNFNGELLTNAQIKNFREPILDQGLLTGSVVLPFTDGHFQKITTNGPITIEVINWPAAGQYGKIRLHVTVADVSHTIQFPATFSLGIGEIAGVDSTGGVHVLTVPAIGDYVFDLSTSDGGTTVIISEHTDKLIKRQIPEATPAAGGSTNDKAGDLAFDGDYLYVCIADYDGVVDIWRRVALQPYGA